MKNSKQIVRISLAAATLLSLNACGTKDERSDSAGSSLGLENPSSSQVALSSTVDETLDSLSDSNFSNNDAGLSLFGDTGPEKTVERTCAESADKAVVSITREKSREMEATTKRFTISNTAASSTKVERTWMKEGTAIKCAPSGKHAAIDFEADLSGYKLDITVDRTSARSSEKTNIKTGAASSSAMDATVKGTRKVEWLSQTSAADGTLSRKKSLSFATQRTSSATLKNGQTKELDLSMATVDGSPLMVTVSWSNPAGSRVLASKLIESGKIKASKAGSGSIETSFSQVLMKFTSDSCSLVSGTVEAKVFAEGSTTVSKSYTITAEDGDVTMMDTTNAAAPTEVEDFEYSPCDLKDFNF